MDLSNLHRVPLRRSELLDKLDRMGIEVWNRRPVDITKSMLRMVNYSVGNPVAPNDRYGPPEEKMLIKANLNSKADPEKRLTPEEKKILNIPDLIQINYQVRTRDDIPDRYWSDSNLYIEKYICNAEYKFFRLYLCGKNLVISKGISDNWIQKMFDRYRVKNYLITLGKDSPPDEVSSIAQSAENVIKAYGLDYGILDAVVDDEDNAYIVDINLTPHWAERPHLSMDGIQQTEDDQPEIIEFLRAGL